MYLGDGILSVLSVISKINLRNTSTGHFFTSVGSSLVHGVAYDRKLDSLLLCPWMHLLWKKVGLLVSCSVIQNPMSVNQTPSKLT